MRRNDVQSFLKKSLPALIKWNNKFPPTDRERERNSRVEKFQGNRNPYVDDYRLVDRIGLENFTFQKNSIRKAA